MSNAEFEQWKMQSPSGDIRRGQHLMNTAPAHIYRFASGDYKLDCFNQDSKVEDFVLFAELCWDTTDPDEMNLARRMIVLEKM